MGISIIVPVGPNPKYFEFLPECLDSIIEQMSGEDEVVLVDDMARAMNGIAQYHGIGPYSRFLLEKRITIYENKWRMGCADCWNLGIAIARNNFCLMMGSDDKLMPGCLDAIREVIGSPDVDTHGWYNLACIDSNGEEYNWYNNAACVSKLLWKATGGFPEEAGLGAPDALMVSCLMVHGPQHLHKIKEDTPLYWVRVWGEGQETPRTGKYWEEIISVRNKVTENFKWKE